MEQFSGRAFYLVGYCLGMVPSLIAQDVEESDYPVLQLDEPASAGLVGKVSREISTAAEWCDSIGLTLSKSHAQRFLDRLKGDITPNQINQFAGELRQRITDEMQDKLFMYIPPERARYYGKAELFGSKVAANFASAGFDIREAGNCLAAGRSTACVFHLMRVLEIGLAAIGKPFGVSLAHTSWGPAIDQIESKIREMHKDPGWKSAPDCKDQQEFFAQAVSYLGVVKDAWRNYTAHARGKYTPDEAELSLRNVRAFMEKISERCSE